MPPSPVIISRSQPTLRHSTRAKKSGFALLITITLLAFLVLLLVSLSSLTRVETQVAGNGQKLTQARQNALLAMNIALGRLQQLAGPDQRVTGTADLISTRDDTKKNWTGIWDARAATLGTQLGWLVSGTAPVGTTGVTGAVIAASGNSLVDLVGANSTDITVATNRVQVETQPLAATGIPGFNPATSVTVGNFAYWVGDEGVKAKVSLTDPWESPTAATLTATGTTSDTAATYRFDGLQRTGMEGMGSNAADTKVGAAYPATDPTFKAVLPNVLQPGQLPLASSTNAATLTSAIKSRFHDLTTSSYSVMTDVADGGLKKDLTAWLAQPDSASNPPRNTAFIANADTYMPRWSQIRSYAGIVADGTAKAPIMQDPTALGTNTTATPQQGIYPVISYARIGYNVSCVGAGSPIAFHIFPVVVLWNPTNVPIAAHDYEMRWDDQDYYNAIAVGKESEAVPDTFSPSHPLQRRATYDKVGLGTSSAFATGYFAYSLVTAAGASTPAPSSNAAAGTINSTPLRFHLVAPQLAPGQSMVFTLADPTGGPADTYQARNNIMGAYAPIQADNSVVIYGPTMAAADLTQPNADPTKPDVPVPYWMGNTGGQEQLSLRDYADPTIVYNWVQNPTSLSRFASSPISSSFTIQPPGLITAPLIYVRASLYQSEGQYGTSLTDPTTWFGTDTRWLALFDPLAPHALRLGGGQTNSFSYAMDTQGVTNPGPSFGNGDLASMGLGPDVSIPTNNLIIHEFSKPGIRLFSLAQLQHVNIAQMNLYPAYAIGNSLASVYVQRDQTVYTIGSGPSGTPTAVPQQAPFNKLTNIYDLSYVLNRALWDQYFFSTVPTTLTAPAQITPDYKLPDSRYVFHWTNNAPAPSTTDIGELKAPATAAAHLLINGGFNVNSTSVEAWRSLLYARNGIATDPADATCTYPFSRYADPTVGVISSTSSVWQGYRVLSSTQIDNLATKIVAQIKLRGPFLSLASFINRRLVAAPDPTGLKGTLQAALDALDADTTITPANRINSRSPFTDRTTGTGADTGISVLAAATNAIPNPAKTGVIRAHWIGDDNDANATQAYTSRAAFAPGYLTQADLLTMLGPILTARSDTFVIRTYGDVQNPTTSRIEAKAWCEAVVQRLPEYMDTSLAPTGIPAAGSTNDTFGRRFKIISFRWLTPSDI